MNKTIRGFIILVIVLSGCVHREQPTTQAEREMMQISSLGFRHYLILQETDIGEQFTSVCYGFFENRGHWPHSIEELRNFWSFAPPEPYEHIWKTYQDSALKILPDGSLSITRVGDKQKMILHTPKN